MKAAAQWLKQHYLENKLERVAIVAPQLQKQSEEFHSILTKVLEPRLWANITRVQHSDSFDLSAGSKLMDCPLVADIFLLLSLQANHIERTKLARLFQSPYWGAYFINSSRQGEIVWCHQQAMDELNIAASLNSLQALKESEKENSLGNEGKKHSSNVNKEINQQKSLFGEAAEYVTAESQEDVKKDDNEKDNDITKLLKFRTSLRSLKANQSIAYWNQKLISLLNELAWPGERTLNTIEYQQTQAFLRALRMLEERSSFYDSLISFKNYQLALKNILEETTFHSENKEARYHVLGLMEAASLNFDAI
jgi:hypothetical protein